MLTLLTTTGARPEAWEICKALMRAQTYRGGVRWIIVDDGPEPQDMSGIREDWQIVGVRPEPLWKPGDASTQARNLLAGLEHVSSAARLVIIEDDDYYAPQYLAVTADRLRISLMVGEKRALYFNLRAGRGKVCGNTKHAGLCSTAMRGDAIEALRKAARENHKFIDLALWADVRGGVKRLYPGDMCIGIKGLPGRGGIGAGHRIERGPISADRVRGMMGRPTWALYEPYLTPADAT